MSFSTAEVLYLDAVTVSADANKAMFDTRNKRSGSVGVKWTGASATDATFKLQESWDNITWSDVSSGSATLSAAAGQTKISLADINVPMMRGVITHGSETTALLTVRYYLKGNT